MSYMKYLWHLFLHNTRVGNLFFNIFIGWMQCGSIRRVGKVGHYCQGMKGHIGRHRDCAGHRWK